MRAAWIGLAIAASPMGRLAAQSIPVTLGGPASSFVGVSYQIPIQVDMSARAEKLGSFLLRITWDPAVVRLDSGINADFGEVFAREDSMAVGVLRMAGLSAQGVGGKVTLGIGFGRPLVADTTTFKVEVLELYAAGTFADLAPSAVPVDRQYCPARGRWGDLEADGQAMARDAQIALLASVGLPVPPGTDVGVGDVDGDGRTDSRDALIILSRVVGLNTGAFRVMRIAPGPCGADRLASTTLDPGDQTLVAAQALQYVLKIADSSGSGAVGSGVTWASTNAAVATVSGGGVVTAVAAGQAVITGTEAGGRQASATITVVGSRKKHVVDALAFNAVNQVGSNALPFSTIQAGVSYAQAGDTVLVRSGRYEGGILITRSVTVLGTADTGLARPFISGRTTPPADSNGVVITGGARVELRGLRFDTLYQAVRIKTADTVVLSDDAFRARSVGLATIYVDSVRALRIRRSRFDGSVTPTFNVYGIYLTGWANVVELDSTLITDYGDDAISLNGIDSLIVRNSILRYNRGYAVYAYNGATADSARVMRAVFSRNVMTENLYGDVHLNDYRSAKFDHNVLVGGGYDGIQAYGDSASVLSFLGDTVAIQDGYWLYTNRYDSLTIDSVQVKVGYYADVNGGRITVLRNSRFDVENYYAIQVNAYPLTSSNLVVRNVGFFGLRTCDRCADGLYAYNTTIDADSVTGDNLDYGIYQNYGDLLLRNATFTNVYRGLYSYCGDMRVDQITITDANYGVYGYGCSPDSLIVDHATMSRVTYGVQGDYVDLVVRNSTFTDGEYGIYSSYGSMLVEDNQLTRHGDDGVYGYSDSVYVVRRNTITCGQFENGIELYHGAMTVRENVLNGCYYGIYVSNTSTATPLGTPGEIRLNTLTMAGNGQYGIGSFGNRENVRVVKNSITGPAIYGSIYVGYSNNPRSVVDSNTITNSAGRAIRAGSSDTLRILDNTITNHLGAPCCGSNGAIVLEAGQVSNASAQVLRNRITFSKSNGIMIARSNSTDTLTVLVDSNAVRGADTIGVWVQQYSRAIVRKNAIDSSGVDGIRVSNNYIGDYCGAPTNSTVANQNNLTRNKQFGLRNIYYCGVYSVVADNNWWGDDEGPRCATGCAATGGDSASVNVT